jgi:microcystin-dependent protein
MSEIKVVSFNYAPRGWALCNGQLLPINQNQALFSLLGTTYGGNGQNNFALPNLRGQVPIHMGNGHTLGEKAGSTSVTVNIQQLPTHLHQFNVSATQALGNGGNVPDSTKTLAPSIASNIYGGPQNLVLMDPTSITNVGGSQPHTNMMPYLVLNFIIALSGIFPSQN